LAYATGSAGLAATVRGSSRRIMIMRFRPANIRLINRRSNLPRLLLALSSGNNKSNDKSKPTNSQTLTRSLHIRADFALHEIVRPKGLLSPHGFAGEDVIVIRCVDTLTAPAEKILCHVAVHGHRFGGGFRLAVAQDLMPDRTRYAEVIMACCPDGLQQPTAFGLKTFLALSRRAEELIMSLENEIGFQG
jgi:hypothetical protein